MPNLIFILNLISKLIFCLEFCNLTYKYLQHTTKENEISIVNASFHVTHWSVQPYGTGISRMKYVGYVFGGDVLRFFHGGDECLTIPSTWSMEAGHKY